MSLIEKPQQANVQGGRMFRGREKQTPGNAGEKGTHYAGRRRKESRKAA